MATAMDENEEKVVTRFWESLQFPGQFCAQAFKGLVSPGKYRFMNSSGWHPTKLLATEDLERRIQLEGLKTAE